MKYFIAISLALLVISCDNEKQEKPDTKVVLEEKVDKTRNLFEQISSEESGITFSNTLKENVGSIENAGQVINAMHAPALTV